MWWMNRERLDVVFVGLDGHAMQIDFPLTMTVIEELQQHWLEGSIWERAPDDDFLRMTSVFKQERSLVYAPEVVIDVPFDHGTFAVGVRGRVGANREVIQVLRELSTLISLAFQRSTDMSRIQQAEGTSADLGNRLQNLRFLYDLLLKLAQTRVPEEVVEISGKAVEELFAEFGLTGLRIDYRGTAYG
jgi:hypothetical protein